MATTALAPIKGQMSVTEAKKLGDEIAQQYVKADGEVGELRRMIMRFCDTHGYRALQYTCFEDWAAKKLPQYGRRYHFKLKERAEVEQRVLGDNIDDAPGVPGMILKELAKVPEDKQAEAWAAINEKMPKDDDGNPRWKGSVARRVCANYILATQAASIEGDGTEVNEKIRPVFECVDDFDQVLTLLRKARTIMHRLVEGPAGAIIAREANGIEEKRSWLENAIKFCKPHAQCIYCRGGGGSGHSVCKACKGTGWLNQDAFDAAAAPTKPAG